MASYRVAIKRSAANELEDLPAKDRRRVADRVLRLGPDPRPRGAEKLSGQERYRLRQGNCRILYEIDDARGLVTVVRIAHRRDAYRP